MSEPIKLLIYRDWQGLNMGNSWWKDHDSATMYQIEHYLPYVHFLDIETNPTITNTFADDAGIDGSRFEYNVLSKTQVKLNFYFEFIDYADFIDKKHDIQEYFAAKAGFIIATSYHPNIHACCYCSKVDIKPTSTHISVFEVDLDNALGMWYSESTSFLQKRWNMQVVRDLRLPTSFESKPSWELKPGTNKVFIAGDVMMQMTNPIMQINIHASGCGNNVTINNKTSNTSLSAIDSKNLPNMTWYNLDLRSDDDNTPLNNLTNSLDFWLDPGWNEIEILGAESATLDCRFYFTNI